MRHVYSLVRFVPDPARGESVNIGVLAGSEDSGEWVLRAVQNLSRARQIDDGQILPNVLAHLETIGAKLDEFSESGSYLVPSTDVEEISESWIARLSAESANVLQFTTPLPLAAETADDAVEQIWDELIVDPASKRFHFQKKHRAVSAVRVAYREHKITSEHLWTRARLDTQDFSSGVDFVVHNGLVAQLTNCWSFQLPDKQSLADELKAWAWTIRDLRSRGGAAVSAEGARLAVTPDVSISVVFVPPSSEADEEAFAHATAVFSDPDVRAQALPYEQAAKVAEEAAGKLR